MSIETPPLARRLGNIQSLRGLAALMVVFSHLLVMQSKYAAHGLLGPWAHLGLAGVDIFFAISGFIMVYVTQRVKTGPKAWAEFLFARVTRIYPLYWLVSLAVLAIYLWQPNMVFSSLSDKPDLLKSCFLYPDSRPPLLVVGWTLIHEMGFYLVFSVSLLFARKYMLAFLLLWATLLGLGLLAGLNTHGPLLSIAFSPLSFEFLAGALAGWIFVKGKGRPSLIVLSLGLIGFGITGGLLLQYGLEGFSRFGLRASLMAVPCAALVYGLASLKTTLPVSSQRLGDWSYALYLTHVLSLSLLARLIYPLLNFGPTGNALALVLMSVFAVLIGALTHIVFEQPMLNAAKALRRRLFAPT